MLNWNEDPEFQALPDTEKAIIYQNYFDGELADDEFRALPPSRQNEIKANFLGKHGSSFEQVDIEVEPQAPVAPEAPPVAAPLAYGPSVASMESADLLDRARNIGAPPTVPPDQVIPEGETRLEQGDVSYFKTNIRSGLEKMVDSVAGSVRGFADVANEMYKNSQMPMSEDRQKVLTDLGLTPGKPPEKAAPVDSEKMKKLSDNMKTFIDQSGEDIPELLKRDGVKGWTDNVVQMIPQIVAQGGAHIATGGIGSVLFMGSQIFGGTYNKLVDEDGVEPVRAAQAAFGNAVMQAPLETLGMVKALSVWKPGKQVTKVFKEIAETMGVEFVTEWLQAYPDAAMDIWGNAKKKDMTPSEQVDKFFEDFWTTTKSGMYEGSVAMIFGGASPAAKGIAQKFDPEARTREKIDTAVITQIEEALKTNNLTSEAARILIQEPFLKHLEPQIEELIKTHGNIAEQTKDLPIVVDTDGEIIDGRHRVAKARAEGKTEIEGFLPVAPKTHGQSGDIAEQTDRDEGGVQFYDEKTHKLVHVARGPQGNYSFYRTKDPKKPGSRIKGLQKNEKERWFNTREDAEAALPTFAARRNFISATKEHLVELTKKAYKIPKVKTDIPEHLKWLAAKAWKHKTSDEFILALKSELPNAVSMDKIVADIAGAGFKNVVAFFDSAKKHEADLGPEAVAYLTESELPPIDIEREFGSGKAVTKEERRKATDKFIDETFGDRRIASADRRVDTAERERIDKSKAAEKITADINKAFPGRVIKFENESETGFQFTPQSGTHKGMTFAVKTLDFESVKKAIETQEKAPPTEKTGRLSKKEQILDISKVKTETDKKLKVLSLKQEKNIHKDDVEFVEQIDAAIDELKADKSEGGKYADDGGTYASTGPYESADPGSGYAATVKKVMELPEILELMVKMTDGQYPGLVKRIARATETTRGQFDPNNDGSIKIRADLFKDPEIAAYVLAHEIGHWVDFLSHKTMARGNILGRLAGLKGYLLHSLPNAPGAPGPLTDKDRSRMHYQAKKNIEAQGNETWIDEIIRKEFPVTPNDVMAIWRAAESDIDADLLLYVKKLNRAQKKAIMKDALKGVVGAELQQFSKTIETKTGKKIKQSISDKQMQELVRQKYADLLNEELVKRKLFDLDEITAELKLVSLNWKPFDPKHDSRYTQYRFSGPELYADAFSVLINRPGMLKSLAPKFYEGFFNYIDSKPEFRDTYNEIQDRLNNPDKIMYERVRGFKEMEDKGDTAYALAIKQAGGFKERIIQEIFDTHWSIIRKVREIDPSKINPEKNPIFKLEDMEYTGSEIEWLLNQVNGKQTIPLEKEGLDWNDFGLEIFLNRVSADRAELGNPKGFTPKTAKETLAYLKENRTPAQNKAMKEAMKEFHSLHKYITDKGIAAKRWGPELIEQMKENKDFYATFDVLEHIQKRMGRGPAAHIAQQIGTLKEISNPATATILKDIAIIKAINRMDAMEATVEFLTEFFPSEIVVAPASWDGKRRSFKKPPPGTGQELLVLMKDGKPQGYYVDEFIASSFKRNPHEVEALSKILQALGNPFRKVFTEYNAGFWLFNIWRDYFRSAGNLEGAGAVTFAKTYMKGIKPAFRSVFGIPDEVMEEMLQKRMLISVENYHGASSQDSELERMLKRFHVSKDMWNGKVLGPIGRFLNFYTNVGRAVERIPKVAGYNWMKQKFPDMTDAEVKHIVRNTGSPDFLRRGRAYPLYNNIFLFSNAIKEGYRGDYEAYTNNKGQWAWKKVKYAVMPKILTKMATVGIFGPWLYALYGGVSEYDKTNYNIIPLGITDSGKAVYFRLPIDETGRLIGGVAWKLLNMGDDESDSLVGLADYMSGQVPTLNPAFGLILNAKSYVTGGNPRDYQDRPAVPEQIREVGGVRSHIRFAKFMANQMGSSAVYRFKNDDVGMIKDELEQLLGYPIASNIIGRFIKVSNQSVKEKLREGTDEIRKVKLGELLDAKDAVHKWIRGEELTGDDRKAIIKKIGSLDRTALIALQKKTGSLFAEAMLRAQSEDEKIFIYKSYLKRKEDLRKAGK